MSDFEETTATIALRYYGGADDPSRGVFARRPVDPDHTAELTIAVYIDDASIGPPRELLGKPLQVQLSGTARALEALGTYLLALARFETRDPDPHEHFEDVKNAFGGTVHLIVRRS